jgi:hypothetical protein
MDKLEQKKKELAGKMSGRAICADRSCKNQSHGHSWMRNDKTEAKRKGRESLNPAKSKTGKDEGETMEQGRNEDNRA